MPTSVDCLAVSTKSILKPAMGSLGFAPYGKRTFVLLNGDILQFVDLQLSAWGSREFAVDYSSLLLFPVREHLSIPVGGRLPRGRSCDGWWSSLRQDYADNSMKEIVTLINERLVPWFNKTKSLD